ncbi:hypothetical protein [Bacillus safensis]|uniref:hypothetical protein n=1 Tax=Bacillus safensis TaxID=561879 RepID=UPI0039819971
MKDKQIGVVHLVYGCIIALLIITFTLAIAFGGNKDAGNQMNVMATGISVVLAVIAILMTLVDVAGQRQSIVDIKETAEKLTKTQEASQDALRLTLETIGNLNEFREELLSTVATYRSGTEDLIKSLSKKLSEKETVTKQDIEEVMRHLDKNASALDSKVRRLDNDSIKKKVNTENDFYEELKKFIKESYMNRTMIPLDDLKYDLLYLSPLQLNRFEMELIIEQLSNEGYVRYDNAVHQTMFYPDIYLENKK